ASTSPLRQAIASPCCAPAAVVLGAGVAAADVLAGSGDREQPTRTTATKIRVERERAVMGGGSPCLDAFEGTTVRGPAPSADRLRNPSRIFRSFLRSVRHASCSGLCKEKGFMRNARGGAQRGRYTGWFAAIAAAAVLVGAGCSELAEKERELTFRV